MGYLRYDGQDKIRKLNEIEQGQIDTGVYKDILDKLEDLINNQFSIPVELQKDIDEHFFDLI